jgi:hypothetical protein
LLRNRRKAANHTFQFPFNKVQSRKELLGLDFPFGRGITVVITRGRESTFNIFLFWEYCSSFCSFLSVTISLSPCLPRSKSVKNMSVEITATIASFGGKLLKLAHKAASTNCDMKFNLFLPPQALNSSATKVPVLIYLSGLTCTGDNCAEKGFFQHRASQKGIAVVYPDTSPSTP